MIIASLLTVLSCAEKGEQDTATPRSITLSALEMNLQVGESRQLEATVLPESAKNREIIWSSTNNEKVSVDGSGLVSAISVGSAYVVAETANGIKASCLVKVTASESQSYKVRLYTDGTEAPQTLYGWPGQSLVLEARSDDGKQHNYRWSSSSEAIGVEEGRINFGLGSTATVAGYSWWAEAVVRAVSVDGCTASVNVVSSISESFRFGTSMEHIGGNVAMLAGKNAEISLSWFDGNSYRALPAGSFSLKSQDPSIVAVNGNIVSSADGVVGSAALSVLLCGREFMLCNVFVEKDGSKDSSGEPYYEYPVVW